MLDGFLKPRFYAKCKSALKLTKVRLDAIKKKRHAVEKYFKNDIADLLKNGLDYNAYGRAEMFLIEQNRTTCYDFIEQFCGCISKNLSVMQKQRECPEECREAVPSLAYAAARFADLPELRDLRTLFNEQYGNSLESFINQEFVQKLRADTPTKEMKLQLMHDVAQEFSIEWDPKALEQKLFKPPPVQQDAVKHVPKNEIADKGPKWDKSKNHDIQKTDNREADIKQSDTQEDTRPKINERDLTSMRSRDVPYNKNKLYSSSEDEVNESTDEDLPQHQTTTSSVRSVSAEDVVENRKPFYYRFIPPPYVKTNFGNEANIAEETTKPSGSVTAADEDKSSKKEDSVAQNPKPRSVRRQPLKPPPAHENLSKGAAKINSGALKLDEARKGLPSILSGVNDERDEEEKIMDGLLMHYSKKPSPKPLSWKTADDNRETGSRAKSNSFSPTARAASLPIEPTTSEKTRGHARATSLQPEILASHVHPKLPDYDDLAARLAALRG